MIFSGVLSILLLLRFYEQNFKNKSINSFCKVCTKTQKSESVLSINLYFSKHAQGRQQISLEHSSTNFLWGIVSIPNSNSKIGAHLTAILFWAVPPLAPPPLRPHLRDSHSDAAQLICYSVRCAKQVSTVFNWRFNTSHKNLIGG